MRSERPGATLNRRAALVAGVLVMATLGCRAASGPPGGASDAAPSGGGTTSTGTTGDVPAATVPPPLAAQDLPTTKETVPDLPGYAIYRPRDLGAAGRPRPVIVWANGGCVRLELPWQRLLERWARAGFVVVAIAYPGADAPGPTMSGVSDQAKAIDWVEQQTAGSSATYAGHLDPARIVAAGNSCGGITSLQLASTDPRVAAVYVLSGSSVGPIATREQAAAVMVTVKVPVGFTVGGPEDISGPQAQQDYDLLAPGIPAYLARRSSADHPKVSTDPGILDEVGEISTNWMDAALYGNPAAVEALEPDPCPACPPGTWTAVSKDLDALLRS